jgi:chorismate-pyruvate lyase
MTPLTRRIAHLFHPLQEFYSEAGAVPRVEAVDPEAMPEPYRGLLVHERDMTTTLETFFDQPLHLELLRVHDLPDAVNREVVLVGDRDGTIAEFGAIRIELARFAEGPRRRVEEGRLPLGTILKHEGIAYACRPNAYFRLESDAVTAEAFCLTRSCTLYGRHNVIAAPGGEVLAEVVEILPPLEPSA